MKPTKFNFVSPEEQSNQGSPYVSLYKNGFLIFSRQYTIDNNLENKFVRFFIDPEKHELGWIIVKSIDTFRDMKSSKYRKAVMGLNKTIGFSIRKILEKLGAVLEGKPVRLEVEEYNDKMLGTIHHITVPTRKVNLYKLAKVDPSPEELAGVSEDIEE